MDYVLCNTGLNIFQRMYEVYDLISASLQFLKENMSLNITHRQLKISPCITVDFTLLFRAALRSSLGSWVLGYEEANYVAN